MDGIEPAKIDLVIYQGETLEKQFEWHIDNEPVDLSEYTARMQAREDVYSDDFLIELTTENGGIDLGSDGTITLNISAEETADLDFDYAVYDLELINADDEVTRLVYGKIKLSKEVTR